jgi:hypothetical protein
MIHLRKTIFALATVFLFGCVSVSLGNNKSKKAQDLKMQEPKSPFHSIKTDNADSAWQSDKTGNTIAVLSECNTPTDISLKSLESDSLTALSQIKIVNSEKLTFNNREAIQTVSEGKVDGVPIRLELLVFKKNYCNYTLSYVGRKASFDSERDFFEQFLKYFEAP